MDQSGSCMVLNFVALCVFVYMDNCFNVEEIITNINCRDVEQLQNLHIKLLIYLKPAYQHL